MILVNQFGDAENSAASAMDVLLAVTKTSKLRVALGDADTAMALLEAQLT